MNARVVGSNYNSDTVVEIECPSCGAEYDCVDGRVGWVIPTTCEWCAALLDRADVIASCEAAMDNWEPREVTP